MLLVFNVNYWIQNTFFSRLYKDLDMSFIFDWIYSGFSSVLQFLGNVGPLFSIVIPFNPT